jgi:8-oxo-dGTP diphosphatase
MDCIDVICGIIINEKRVLVAQRGLYKPLPLMWEFPGGKKINGESDRECLERELFEELNIKVKVKEMFSFSEYTYTDFKICLKAYLTEIIIGTLLTYEHIQIKWVPKENLLSLQWAPADIPIVEVLKKSGLL